MSDRYRPFRGFLRSLEQANKQGPLDITDMLAEARRKREAGESLSAWIARQNRIVNKNNWRDHDKEHERETNDNYEKRS